SVWLTGYALHYAPVSTPADIGRSTITTARYLFESGLNPYATPVDMDAGPIGTGFHFFNGYKYFPLTLCFNYPFVLAFGRNGIYIANYLLTIACLAALLVLGRDLFTGAPPHIALALTATSPFLLHELFRQGVNDMLPIACTVASVALLQRRHCGAAGLALGLGMSAKYMPGLLAAPLLLIAARRRARFLIACTAPMLLIVGPFILMAPKEFTGSIILYYLGQTPDSTSVLFFLPPALQHIWPVLGLAVLAFIHAAFLVRTVIYRKHTGEAGGLLLHLCLAIGAACLFTKVNHRNYLMWPLPFLALCLGDLGTTLAALTPWRRGRHERSDTT
ncbi:DUF2029 domain-containing protein, partial [bacterium]|nr:DUF2029 domain-containing protein [candidate division CSSED10-310 bacterium]